MNEEEIIDIQKTSERILANAIIALQDIGKSGDREKYLQYAPQVLDMIAVFEQKII